MDRGEIKSESESFKPIVEKFELFALEQGVSLEQVRQFDYFVMHDSTNTGQHVILNGLLDGASHRRTAARYKLRQLASNPRLQR